MDRQEAVQKIVKVARISVAHAEDLYDTVVPKPVIPYYIADYIEEVKNKGDYTVVGAVNEAPDGRVGDVFLKPHDFADPEWSLKDAIGDSIVTLIVLCLQLGYDVEECLTIAYNDIKDRKGVMIDDNFVKTKTRQPANNSNDSTTSITSH